MAYLRKRRCIELSTIDYLTTSINTDWTGISTVLSFAEVYATTTKLPVVCIRLADTNNNRLEMGSDTLDSRYMISIDIFATSDGQRLDLADYVCDKLKDGWIYYTYSQASGHKETLTKVADGRIYVTSFLTDTKVDAFETVEFRDKYRHNITVTVRANQ